MTSAQLSLDDAANAYVMDTDQARGVLALIKEAQRSEYSFIDGDTDRKNIEPIFLALVGVMETLATEGKKLHSEVRGFLEKENLDAKE